MTPTSISTLRNDLASLLEGGHAFATPSRILGDVPAHARGARVEGYEHTLWDLLEHMRIDEQDILDICTSTTFRMLSPEEFWPARSAPESDEEWSESIDAFFRLLERARSLALDESIDLMSAVPNGTQSWLRMLMLLAEHNAHHLGQFVVLRKMLGVW